MAQQLRTLPILPEDQGSTPSNQHSISQPPAIPIPQDPMDLQVLGTQVLHRHIEIKHLYM